MKRLSSSEFTAGTKHGAAMLHTNTTSTPSGASPSQTITLNNGDQQKLVLTSASGTVALTLTVPSSDVATGSILIEQHASSSVGITWAVSAGSIFWLGVQPTWSSIPVGKKVLVYYRSDATTTVLSATAYNGQTDLYQPLNTRLTTVANAASSTGWSTTGISTVKTLNPATSTLPDAINALGTVMNRLITLGLIEA